MPSNCSLRAHRIESYKSAIGKNRLDYSSGERGTIQWAFVFWNAYEFINEWILFNDIICTIVVVGMLQFFSFFSKQTLEMKTNTFDVSIIALRIRRQIGCTFHSVVLMNSNILMSFVSRLEFRSRTKYRSMTRIPTSLPRSCNLEGMWSDRGYDWNSEYSNTFYYYVYVYAHCMYYLVCSSGTVKTRLWLYWTTSENSSA